MRLCIIQLMLFNPLCFDHLVLAPHSAFRKARYGQHANEVAVLQEYMALQLSVCHSRKIAHPLLRSTGPSAQAIANELPRLLPQH